MPLFYKKFSIPKFPNRKASSMSNLSQLDATIRSTEFGVDYQNEIRAKLNGQELIFQNGNWIFSGEEGGASTNRSLNRDDSFRKREVTALRQENQRLLEEKNLLQVKLEILLDMLAESTAEVQLQENEIDSLRDVIHKKSSTSIN
ncbi:Protein chibby 1 [Cichlidogyrus casuarinus]|uniref:Protein chibby 1 n=1 Tax=Cichlidogyrus casuarinus TaxID=1844966 RepID=A0ABD2QGG8_9PLAT